MASKAETLELLRIRIDRLIRADVQGMPDVICALNAVSIVQSLAMLYPSLWTEFGRHLQKVYRNHSGLCSDCGVTPIPALLSHTVSCKDCGDELDEQLDGMGIDPHEPHAPKDEEMIVDMQIAQGRLVDNLDEDYLDQLERLLEGRRQ